jgi:hypothetical protein
MPSRPTETETETVLALIRAGNALERAAAYVGIAQRDLHEWMRLGKDGKGGKAVTGFYRQVMRSLAEADLRDMHVIAEAASETWQAAKTRIEMRRDAERDRDIHRLRALTTDVR